MWCDTRLELTMNIMEIWERIYDNGLTKKNNKFRLLSWDVAFDPVTCSMSLYHAVTWITIHGRKRDVPPDHLLLDRSPNIEPLISRWELDKFKNCWNKSFRTSRILTLLYQQFSNLLISQRDMGGPRLGALSNDRWSRVGSWLYRKLVTYITFPMGCHRRVEVGRMKWEVYWYWSELNGFCTVIRRGSHHAPSRARLMCWQFEAVETSRAAHTSYVLPYSTRRGTSRTIYAEQPCSIFFFPSLISFAERKEVLQDEHTFCLRECLLTTFERSQSFGLDFVECWLTSERCGRRFSVYL